MCYARFAPVVPERRSGGSLLHFRFLFLGLPLPSQSPLGNHRSTHTRTQRRRFVLPNCPQPAPFQQTIECSAPCPYPSTWNIFCLSPLVFAEPKTAVHPRTRPRISNERPATRDTSDEQTNPVCHRFWAPGMENQMSHLQAQMTLLQDRGGVLERPTYVGRRPPLVCWFAEKPGRK